MAIFDFHNSVSVFQTESVKPNFDRNKLTDNEKEILTENREM